jgi:type I restriction enzyme S subunit
VKEQPSFLSEINDSNNDERVELPAGWVWRKLGDVGKYINGRAFKPTDWETQGLPIIRIQNLTDPNADFNYYSKPVEAKYYVENDELLISWSATLDAFIWNRGRAILNQHIFRVEENRSLVERKYLYFVVRAYLYLLKSKTHGTSMQHITRGPFESTEIPLPPLSEQRRIVERIEAFAQRMEETLDRLNQVDHEFDALCRSIVFDTSDGDPTPTPMRELIRLRIPDVVVLPAEIYAFAGLKSFGRGVFKGPVKSGAEFAYPRLTRLHAGEFVYPKLMAWEGAFGVVPPECDGLVVSTEFPVFEVNQEKVLPETLDVYFRTPSVWPMISEISTGTNARRKRLHPSALLAYEMPLPPMKTQLRLREMKRRVDELRQRHASQRKELETLMPAVLDRAFRGEL